MEKNQRNALRDMVMWEITKDGTLRVVVRGEEPAEWEAEAKDSNGGVDLPLR